jgi:hypothetical protein
MKTIPMKNIFQKNIFFFLLLMLMLGACSKKSGCPSNGKNVGAERLMSGEKVPKAKKFKV